MKLINKVIILNGPPDSGKDVIADYICNLTGATHSEFKEYLYEFTADKFGIDLNVFKYLATDRDCKETRQDTLQLPWGEYTKLCGYVGKVYPRLWPTFYLTPREALIYASELDAKIIYGQDYFGQKAAEKLTTDKGNVFSDGGFVDEIYPLIEKVGQDNIHIVHLYRDGKSFSGDSRNYINIEGINTFKIINDDTIEVVAHRILEVIND